MKKIVLILSVIAFVSCQQGKIDRMQAVQDSLAQAAFAKDSAILNFVSAMTEIQENLDSIKRMEDIVRIESADVSEGRSTDKEQILSDIAVIHELMQKNKQLIEQLQKQLGKSNAKVAELQRAIVVLNRQIEQKDVEISTLKAEMEKLNLDIAGMTTRMSEMADESMRKDEALMAKSSTIEEQTRTINTAFYAFGSQKELIENELIEKKGGVLGVGRSLKMKQDFDKTYFTQIDIREVKKLDLHAKKAQLVTNHAAGSYHFVGDGMVESLVIDNPQEFWRTSKYLIIVLN